MGALIPIDRHDLLYYARTDIRKLQSVFTVLQQRFGSYLQDVNLINDLRSW
jgi:hypothetical protein